MQLTMFSGHEKFTIDKPIRLIELFAGYGSQALALKYLGVDFEHWRICEWAVKSIQAYKDMHFSSDNTDYSKNLTQQEVIDFLVSKGISANYNEPMTEQQIKRLDEQKQRQIFNNIKSTHNLVNIQQVKASDLEIIDKDKYCYIMTYSFPCQDLSKAGKGKGMAKNSGTRSGMLWEVERILDECNGNLPQILLMENVPDVIGSKNIQHFAKWLEKLESIGYKCYWQVLNAKDYGIPQNRERCFMISLLGDYLYEFPEKQKLEIRLKDLLEDSVDEKYYLSDNAIKGSLKTNFASSKLENKIPKDGICPTICARDYKDPKCIIEPQLIELTKNQSQGNRVYDVNGLSVSLCANGGGMGAKTGLYKIDMVQKVKTRKYDVEIDKLKKLLKSHKTLSNKEISQKLNKPITLVEHWFRQDDSFAIPSEDFWFKLKKLLSINTDYFDKQIIEYEIKDNVFESSNRVYIEDGICPTLTTSTSPNIIKNETSLKTKLCNELIASGKVKENDVIRHSYSTSRMKEWDKRSIETNNISPTLDTRCDCLGVVVNYEPIMETNYRIRKLTPKECFRLMGVKDEDFDKVAQNQSNASLYHLAGDSIVVNVLMAIFSKILKE